MLNWESVTIGRERRLLEDDEILTIIERTYKRLMDRVIPIPKFFSGWYVRENKLSELYDRYKRDQHLRTALNSYLYEGKTFEFMVYKDMKQVIDHGECIVIQITGGTGSGKSWLALSLLQDYSLLMKRNMRIVMSPKEESVITNNFGYSQTSNMYLTYDTSETNTVFRKLIKEWDMALQDESPYQHGKGSRTERDNFENVVSVATRRNKISLVLLNPFIIELTNVNFYLEVIGTIRSELKTCCLLYNCDCKPIGVCVFKIIVNSDVLKQYDDISFQRKKQILESGGFSSSMVNEEELAEKVSGYLAWCFSHNVNTRAKVKLYVPRYEPVANYVHKDIVIEEVWDRIQLGQENDDNDDDDEDGDSDNENGKGDYDFIVDNKTKKEKLERIKAKEAVAVDDLDNEFDISFHEFAVRKYQKKNPKHDAVTSKILELWLTGATMEAMTMHSQVGLKSVSSIVARLKVFKDGTAGKWYEEYVAVIKGVEPFTAGNTDAPDLIVASKGAEKWNYQKNPKKEYDNLVVYSVKFWSANKKSYYNIYDDCYPEAMFCIKNNIDSFVLRHYALMNQSRKDALGDRFEENAIEIEINPRLVRSVEIDLKYQYKLVKGRGSNN